MNCSRDGQASHQISLGLGVTGFDLLISTRKLRRSRRKSLVTGDLGNLIFNSHFVYCLFIVLFTSPLFLILSFSRSVLTMYVRLVSRIMTAGLERWLSD